MRQENKVWKELRARLLDIIDEAMRVENAACGKIRVLDPDSGALTIRAQRGFSERFVESFKAIDPDDELPAARAAREKRRVTVPDLAAAPVARPYVEGARHEGVKAMQATPIVGSNGRVLGTLSTHFPRVHQTSHVAGVVLDWCAEKAASVIEEVLPS